MKITPAYHIMCNGVHYVYSLDVAISSAISICSIYKKNPVYVNFRSSTENYFVNPYQDGDKIIYKNEETRRDWHEVY